MVTRGKIIHVYYNHGIFEIGIQGVAVLAISSKYCETKLPIKLYRYQYCMKLPIELYTGDKSWMWQDDWLQSIRNKHRKIDK